MGIRRFITASAGAAALASSALAQPPATTDAHEAEVVGDWFDGPQVESGGIRFAVHFPRQGNVLRGTIDIPELGAVGVPLTSVKAENAQLIFDLPSGYGHYAGVWDPLKHGYVGTFTSPGGNGPFTFVRGTLPPLKPVSWSTAPMAPGFAYTPAPAAHAKVGPTLPVGKCINISDTLEAPIEGAWGTMFHDDDFRIVRDAGFQTVRIPVRWSAHAEESSPYTIDPAFLARVHHVVDLATAAGLNVILNDHNYDALDAAPEANTARFAALWRQIAASFAGAGANVWFELENEPHNKLSNANLMHVFAPALAAIRETNKTRPVLVGGESWSGISSLATLPMPDDPYVVPTIHYYDPFEFTHQGATWVGPNPPPIGRAYGSAADKAQLDQSLQKVRNFMASTGRVPLLGEYGAQDDARVPLEQRIRYYRTVSAAFASIGIQSCAWGYRVGFRLREGDHWLPGLVESIATTKP
jgi:endoglucanase